MTRLVLTFDDGPRATSTNKLLEILAHYNLRAAFFINGTGNGCDVTKIGAILDEGHVLGNHTWAHVAIPESFGVLHRYMLGHYKYTMKYWRAPFGNYRPLVKVASDLGYLSHTGWNRDSRDWKNKHATAVRLVNLLTASASTTVYGRCEVALFHDRPDVSTKDVLPRVIDLLGKKFEIVSFDDDFATVAPSETAFNSTWAIQLESDSTPENANDAVELAKNAGLAVNSECVVRKTLVNNTWCYTVFLVPRSEMSRDFLLASAKPVFKGAAIVTDSTVWQ